MTAFIEPLILLTIIYFSFILHFLYLSLCDEFVSFQILEQHIRRDLPHLKAELNSRMRAVMKELQMYGKVVESKVSCHCVAISSIGQC